MKFSKPRRYNANLIKPNREIDLFIEERKDEFLEFLSENHWEDNTSRRKNFAWNHPEYVEFEFSHYDVQQDLLSELEEKGLIDD